MIRSVVFILGISLALTLAARSEADLGCTTNQGSGPQLATCTQPNDCAPVGGVDCTNDTCFCPNGPNAPFCPCLETGPTQSAPVLSSAGLIGLVGLLCTVGLVGLWRRANPRRG